MASMILLLKSTHILGRLDDDAHVRRFCRPGHSSRSHSTPIHRLLYTQHFGHSIRDLVEVHRSHKLLEQVM